jgi:putative aminopeptidase FrvX
LDETIELLKTVTEAHGVPGHETEVRAVLRELMEPLGDLSQDKLGSLICRQPGDGPKVMIAGHMDEIGFMAHHITGEGFIKFVQLGGWWDQVLLGQRVIIKSRQGDVTGVIGAKPPHLLDAEERDKVVKKKDMFIDIGASSREEVEQAGVRLGDPIVPDSQFAVLANGKTYLAKAFDDRIGCALVVDVLRHFASGSDHPNDLYGVATVMEEVGLRGATTSARAVDPDVAIILESDIAGDVPGIKDEESHIKMGGGPTVLIYDARMIPNLALRDLVVDIAGELGIPLQFSSIQGGATDGAAIHLHGTGVPTVVVAVAARHIHSHGAIIHRDDYDRALQLLQALVLRLDQATVDSLTR